MPALHHRCRVKSVQPWKFAAVVVIVMACRPALRAALAEPDAPAATPESNASANDETAAKNAILHSDPWCEVREAFGGWLSVQKVYNANQVEQINARLRKRIAQMSAEEMKTAIVEMEAKLAILMSPEASDDRYWLGQFASPRVVFSPRELQQFDIVTS